MQRWREICKHRFCDQASTSSFCWLVERVNSSSQASLCHAGWWPQPVLPAEPVPCSSTGGSGPQGTVEARTWKPVCGRHVPLAQVLICRVYFHIKWGRVAGQEPERCLLDNSFLRGSGEQGLTLLIIKWLLLIHVCFHSVEAEELGSLLCRDFGKTKLRSPVFTYRSKGWGLKIHQSWALLYLRSVHCPEQRACPLWLLPWVDVEHGGSTLKDVTW